MYTYDLICIMFMRAYELMNNFFVWNDFVGLVVMYLGYRGLKFLFNRWMRESGKKRDMEAAFVGKAASDFDPMMMDAQQMMLMNGGMGPVNG